MSNFFDSIRGAFTGYFSLSDMYRLKIYEQKIEHYEKLLLASRKYYLDRVALALSKDPEEQQAKEFVDDLGITYLDSLIYISKDVADKFSLLAKIKGDKSNPLENVAEYQVAYFELANAIRDDLHVEKFHDVTTLLSDVQIPLKRDKQ